MYNKILWDCHMHSSFSSDSTTDMENMILAAMEKGLHGICITEHYDKDYPISPEGLTFVADLPAYKERLFSLREKYNGRLTLLYGIELGLQPHLADFFRKLLQSEPFDFVIGSSHLAHGKDPFYPEFYNGRTQEEAYGEYFLSILENLNYMDEMDTYGHLDYVVRYGPAKNEGYSYEKYRDILDEILTVLVRRNIALEVNTGGFHYGLGQPNPCMSILQRYRELGGELLTVGADAHNTEKIAYAFDQTADLLTAAGFRYYTVFQERKPVFYEL